MPFCPLPWYHQGRRYLGKEKPFYGYPPFTKDPGGRRLHRPVVPHGPGGQGGAGGAVCRQNHRHGRQLYEALSQRGTVYWHWQQPCPEPLAQAAQAQVYLTSVNALAETGQLVNIDGTGNRISAAAGAHETVCYLVGRNKIAPTFQQALWRARNIAAPLNARRLHRKTPCAQGETLRCYDCRSPERICNGLSVLWRPLGGVGETLVCLVGEDLGY